MTVWASKSSVLPTSPAATASRACASGLKCSAASSASSARPGAGTLVELRVPLAQRHPAERARVLLVDDHAAIREAIALAFAQDDEFIVTGQAASLAEARGLLDGIDVAIVDLELPDGDGADLIEDLRARDPRIQTLVLSAHADRANVARAVQKGAAAVLGKTTHLHEVVSTVRRCGPARR